MPFDVEDFFAVFAAYNAALWPAQLLAYAGGLFIVSAAIAPGSWRARAAGLALAAMWAVNGAGYHWAFFTAINPAAWGFGALFLAQALALAAAAFAAPGLRFAFARNARSFVAGALIAYAMAVYPLLGWLAGHGLRGAPHFGIAPCPTTIFTIGALLLAPWRAARFLYVIPAIWAAIGGSAAFLLDVPQDLGLIVALAVAAGFAMLRLAGRRGAAR